MKKSKFKRFPSYLRLFRGVGQTPLSTAAESFGNFLKQSVFFPLGPVFFQCCIFFFFCIIIKNLFWFLGIFEMLCIFRFKTNFIFLENLLLFGKLFVAFSFFSACCTLYRFCFKLPWIFPDHAYIFKGCIFKSRNGFRATSDKREWKVQMWDLRFSIILVFREEEIFVHSKSHLGLNRWHSCSGWGGLGLQSDVDRFKATQTGGYLNISSKSLHFRDLEVCQVFNCG